MNTPISGIWFSGENLTGHPVTLQFEGTILRVDGLGESQTVSLREVKISDRLGSTARFIYFSRGASIETLDNDAIDAALAQYRPGGVAALIHWLEQRSPIALAATVMLVASVAALVFFGLPRAARYAAFAVPASVEERTGQAALASFDRLVGGSGLSRSQQARVRAQLDRLAQARHWSRTPRLEFRSVGKFANAFALPGGILVISDELVLLANDSEIAAVLAHEAGHWQHRHGLQSLFSNSAALLVISTITGDLSTLTTFAGSLPLMLLQRGYSRDHETEADDYALETLRLAKIDPRYLATILTKLERNRPAQGNDFSYLSTHPATSERTKRIDPSGTFQSLIAAPAAESPVPPAAASPDKPAESPAKPETSAAHATESQIKPITFAPTRPAKRQSVGSTPATTAAWAQVDTPPVPVHRTPPEYPPLLRAAGVTGTVSLEFIIDKQGNVVAAEVTKSTHSGFDQSALDAVLKWKFSPGRIKGRAVNTRAQIDIPFTLSVE